MADARTLSDTPLCAADVGARCGSRLCSWGKGGRAGRLLIMGELMSGCIIGCHTCMCAQLLQSCPALCNPMDCSPPSSSVHGILQARILEWVLMPSSRGSSYPRDQTHISCGSCVAAGATGEAPEAVSVSQFSCSVMSDSMTPWTAARQASLSITNSWISAKLISIKLVLSSKHLILC